MINVNIIYFRTNYFVFSGFTGYKDNNNEVDILSSGLKAIIESLFAITKEEFKLGALIIFCAVSILIFFINCCETVINLIKNIFYNKSNDGSSGGVEKKIPAKGENPEWDAFLEEVLRALGLTAAQVTGAILWEIWKAYQLLLQSGDYTSVIQVLIAALKELGVLLPTTLPLFIFISILVFTFSLIARDIRDTKKKQDEEAKRRLKSDKILENLDNVMKSEGFKSYTKSWGFLLRKSIEAWLKERSKS